MGDGGGGMMIQNIFAHMFVVIILMRVIFVLIYISNLNIMITVARVFNDSFRVQFLSKKYSVPCGIYGNVY